MWILGCVTVDSTPWDSYSSSKMLEKPMVLTRSKQSCLRQPQNFLQSFNIAACSRVIQTSISHKKTRASSSKDYLQSCCFAGDRTKLYGLSEEVLVLILEHLDARSLIRMSKTCRLFHRLCHSDVIWRHRCKVRGIVLLCCSSLKRHSPGC